MKTATISPTTTTYSYDGGGVRLQASTGPGASEKTSFLWDVNQGLPQLALERDGANALLRRNTYGLRRLTMVAGSTTSFYHYDGLGSVASITGGAGNTRWTYSYDPFGGLRSEQQGAGTQPANLMRYTGEYNDPTGFYHLRARQYEVSWGRFLRPDPVDVGVGSPHISAYGYAGNRPTVMVDPSGETFRSFDRARAFAKLSSSIRPLIGEVESPMTALSPVSDTALSSTSFRVGSCLFSALRANEKREWGTWLPGKRTGVGQGEVSCSKHSYVYFRVCTQKVSSEHINEERCNKHIARIDVDQSTTRVGPELETRWPCPVVRFRSRIRTETQSATSTDFGNRLTLC